MFKRRCAIIARIKEFHKEQALHQAMLLFWKNGYEATSIPELLNVMGISRSSLYDTFTDKQTLYISALEHYKAIYSRKRDILDKATNVKDGIDRFFKIHISSAYDPRLPGGCFITNAAISLESSEDKQVNQLIKDSLSKLEQSFFTLLEKGKNSGEINRNVDIKALTSLLLNLNHSINVMAKAGKDKQEVEAMISFVIHTYL
ncbi:TetR/AcrR family transcriptional regulator [Gracilibacillus suaedae]|uniref:TetR/AcrR family transcriptional regulator n=1 Tax=Gracilibacillus suaedae TaxID=2820273 RepID=UPI001E6337EB|nr:TetR/AcrR family transcriptional regulator [Gracilibacillus suaedae]